MIVSKEETRQALRHPNVERPKGLDDAVIKLVEADTIKEVTARVKELPDREELVARIKEQVDAGTYHHSGEVIADAMARRALADRIR
ncbi:hypothetical protein CCB81_07975 [Armatimonadetes bacterium Uphvl-Ar2]|nr:hypothetical protein CCB81_07975 [Armatimonadetes bacterium Uphvl-Ar2]MCE2938382.1 flagellar biosynthesis anti-sigma factor FlgM [Fimbriimonadaceae bacterium]MCZ8139112.1 flagellar biosynthesis anti-sigma factor FlgM [Fimbriimonadaceae bacterium]